MTELTLLEGSSQVGTSWECQKGMTVDRTDQQLEGETLRLASGHLLGAEEDTAPRTYQGFLAKAEPVVEGSCTGDSWLKPVFSLLPLQSTQTEPLAAETCPCVSLLSPCRPLTPATGATLCLAASASVSAACSNNLCLPFPPT